MANTDRERALEKAALDAIGGTKTLTADSPRGDFAIVENRPLPEGFVNPPCGEEGHLCLTHGKVYDPTWIQCRISSTHDKQRNPQTFSLLGNVYAVPLDTWCDVPPGVVESLKSAVETHHSYSASPGQINLGEEVEHKVIERKRFHYETIKSA